MQRITDTDITDYTSEDFVFLPEDFVYLGYLGSGAFGVTKLFVIKDPETQAENAIHKERLKKVKEVLENNGMGNKVAIKFNLHSNDPKAVEEFQHEANVCSHLFQIAKQLDFKCPGSVARPATFDGVPVIMMRFEKHGNALDFFETLNQNDPTAVIDRGALLVSMLHDLFKNMQFLHRNGILHLDMRAVNICIDKNGHASLIDFGLSEQIPTDNLDDPIKLSHSHFPQLPWTNAVSMFKREYNGYSDIFSFKVAMFELMAIAAGMKRNQIFAGGYEDPINAALKHLVDGDYTYLQRLQYNLSMYLNSHKNDPKCQQVAQVFKHFQDFLSLDIGSSNSGVIEIINAYVIQKKSLAEKEEYQQNPEALKNELGKLELERQSKIKEVTEPRCTAKEQLPAMEKDFNKGLEELNKKRLDQGRSPIQLGVYPLIAAGLGGSPNASEMVNALLGAGADLNQVDLNKTDEEGNTLLLIALNAGDVDIVKRLVKAGANPDQANKKGVSPLFAALGWSNKEDSIEMLNALLKTETHQIDLNQTNKEGNTLLLAALKAGRGHVDVVKRLLKAGANPNQANQEGVTPLFAALGGSHKVAFEMVNALLEAVKTGSHKVDLNQTNKEGNTLLLVALKAGHVDVVKLLLNAGANPNQANQEGVTPLFAALGEGHKEALELVNALLGAGADLNQVDLNQINKEGNTLLLIAVKAGHVDVVEYLLKAGANPNQSNQEGIKPLIAAGLGGSPNASEMVNALLGAGADLNQVDLNKTDEEGNTLLLIAVKAGHVDIVKRLVKAGANPNQANQKGVTPLYFAAASGNLDLVKLLLENGANAATPVKVKIVTIQTLVRDDNVKEYVKKPWGELLEKKQTTEKVLGLPPSQEISITPHEIAAAMGHKDIAKLLPKKMWQPNVTPAPSKKIVEVKELKESRFEIFERDKKPVAKKPDVTPVIKKSTIAPTSLSFWQGKDRKAVEQQKAAKIPGQDTKPINKK